MDERSKRREEALIQVWNKLEGMWMHDNDGSAFFPVPKEFKDDCWNPKLVERRKKYGDNSILFDIIFNEIRPLITKHVSPLRQKDLH